MALVIASTSRFFRPLGVVGLPVEVTSSGWVLPFQDETRIWINLPGEGEALQLRMDRSRKFSELPPLPFVAAGVARCGQDFVVTGADADGRPVVLAEDPAGRVLWRHTIDAPDPARWPVPGCAAGPVVVWLTESGSMEVAGVEPGGIRPRGAYAAGGPPLDIGFANETVWAAWSDESGVWALALGGAKTRVDTSYAHSVAVGRSGVDTCVAWARDDSAWLASIGPKLGAVKELNLASAVGGSLKIVPAEKALVWARRTESIEDEPLRTISALATPEGDPLVIEGAIEDVACHGSMVAVLGSSEVWFFERS